MLSVSIGVCAYNEEKNIRRTLDSILAQTVHGIIQEIIVVSSGSTDGTDGIVMEYATKEGRIGLLRQEKREGKNSAVNAFMATAKGDILVLVNADNNLGDGALDYLVSHFDDPKVGVVGGRPMPVNRRDTIPGFAVYMLWDMHHRLSLIYPKVGEAIAFRNLRIQIPTGMQSDEDLVRMDLEKRGYRTEYEPRAIVVNKGPDTVRDYWKQRTRVNIGERYMKRLFDFDIPTWDSRFLFQAYLGFLKDNSRHFIRMATAMGMEMLARVYASIYVKLDKGDKVMWSMVESTKTMNS
ncbi:MAG TPA: glycosyltransferase [Methanomassiliicoccales archaeon]|jgi:cellulose synthase/poly-beta-1,6-N-acetylglucosamine synthase-like glycosyltransferase